MAEPYSIGLSPNDTDPHAFANYITGFTDGEGCFQLRICTLHKKRGIPRPTPSAVFSVGLRADDLPILLLIQTFFGCGHIVRGKGNGIRCDSMRYQVTGAIDLFHNIIPHFDRYPLRAKKARDYPVWKEGVLLIRHVANLPRKGSPKKGGSLPRWTPERLARFHALKKSLASGRSYAAPPVTLIPPPPPPEPSLFD